MVTDNYQAFIHTFIHSLTYFRQGPHTLKAALELAVYPKVLGMERWLCSEEQLFALAEDQNLVPSTHIVPHNYLQPYFQRV